MSNDTRSSSSIWRSNNKLLVLVVFIGPILVAVIIHYILFVGIESPPPTYGTGTMFNTIATRYDTINRILAMGMDIGWRKNMVAIIRDSISTTTTDGGNVPMILDVATGTADVAIQLAKSIPYAKIVGIDPSNNMLNIGRQKIEKEQLENRITLQYADAQELIQHFAKQQQHHHHQLFDAATMSFGIRNVPNREKALCEIAHVLKNNALFCILEFSEPDGTDMIQTFARMFIRYIVPSIGGILSGSPREYWHLQKSIDNFPKPNDFIEYVITSDCTNTRTTDNDSKTSINRSRFLFKEMKQLNFGSVQLYVFITKKETEVGITTTQIEGEETG